MASILIKLDTRRANAEGLYPAKLIIFSNQTNAAISLNVSLPARAWIKDGVERPVEAKYPGARVINDSIQNFYIKVRSIISDLELSGQTKRMKAADIKQFIFDFDTPVVENSITFYSFAGGFIQTCKAKKTREGYEYAINKLKNENKNLSFENITYSFLRDFDDKLCESGLGINARSIIFRNIRTIFNRAIDDDVIEPVLYPFRKFKIKSEQRDKECLTAEQVRTLYNYEFKTNALSMARDFWMLSFLLCGINPIDLYNLKKPSKDRTSFIRSKMMHASHDTIKLLIQPEAQAIIDKYKAANDSDFLLMFESKYVNYDSFKHFVSKKIREVAEITGFTGLTLYWARYSWATIADSLDIPEKTISKGLGHVDKSMAGRKYIAFDWSKVDRANREVIDFILQHSAPSQNVKNDYSHN